MMILNKQNSRTFITLQHQILKFSKLNLV